MATCRRRRRRQKSPPLPSLPRLLAEKPGIKGVTTPMDVALGISKGLAKKVVVAKVDGATWDMARPLQGDCALQLLSFEDPEGKEVRGRTLGSGSSLWVLDWGLLLLRRQGGRGLVEHEGTLALPNPSVAPPPPPPPPFADLLALQRARAGPGA